MKRVILCIFMLTISIMLFAVDIAYDPMAGLSMGLLSARNIKSDDQAFRFAFDLNLDIDVAALKIDKSRISIPIELEYQSDSNIYKRRQITQMIKAKFGLNYQYEFKDVTLGAFGHIGFEYFPIQRASSSMWDVGLSLYFPIRPWCSIGVPITVEVDNQLISLITGIGVQFNFMRK